MTEQQGSLVALGLELAALGLVVIAILSLVTGTARPLGCSFRMTIEPALRALRDRTSFSRSELADGSILTATVLAVGSLTLEQQLLALLIAPGLLYSRPALRRAMREENRLLAIAGSFTTDLLIGVYAPVAVAQFLTGRWLLGTCLLAVAVALSWPAGGGSAIPGRRWKLAPVPV